MADEIEEELILGDAEDLVRHLHKQAEALAYKKGQLRRILLRNLSGHQVELLNQGFAEILSSRGGLDQDCLDFDFYEIEEKTFLLVNESSPPLCRPGNKLCAKFPWFCAEFLQLQPGGGILRNANIFAFMDGAKVARLKYFIP